MLRIRLIPCNNPHTLHSVVCILTSWHQYVMATMNLACSSCTRNPIPVRWYSWKFASLILHLTCPGGAVVVWPCEPSSIHESLALASLSHNQSIKLSSQASPFDPYWDALLNMKKKHQQVWIPSWHPKSKCQ